MTNLVGYDQTSRRITGASRIPLDRVGYSAAVADAVTGLEAEIDRFCRDAKLVLSGTGRWSVTVRVEQEALPVTPRGQVSA